MATNTQVNGKDYYRIVRTIGHEMKNGKKVPIRKQFYGTSKTDATNKYKEWLLSQERLKDQTVISNKPFGDVLKFYMDNVLAVTSKYKDSTKERYADACSRFMASNATGLLSTPIQAVTSADIQLAYNRFDVALSTVQTLNKCLKGFFKWAIMNRYCTDVLSAVTIPKKTYTKRSEDIIVWTDDELDMIEAAMDGERVRIIFYLGKYAGLRISEMLGLKYGDIDDDCIHIRRQYYRGDLTDPKYDSFRDIPLHPVLREEIQKHKAWHIDEMQANKYRTEFILTTSLGTHYDYNSLRHKFESLYAQNGIEQKPFHTYRHTFCTNLCKAGAPIQAASKLMGHKSVDVTSRFYTFVDREQQADAINLLK